MLTLETLQAAMVLLKGNRELSEFKVRASAMIEQDEKMYKINNEMVVSKNCYAELSKDFEEGMKKIKEFIDMDKYFEEAKKETKTEDVPAFDWFNSCKPQSEWYK